MPRLDRGRDRRYGSGAPPPRSCDALFAGAGGVYIACMPLHMIKLCVGCDTVEELVDWHGAYNGPHAPWTMHTRQTPKRAAEMIDGGSLFRVFKGVILCRQRIVDVATVGQGPNARCEVTLDAEIVRVAPTPRRAFQGWRYLEVKDAPEDLAADLAADVPPELARQLRELGAW